MKHNKHISINADIELINSFKKMISVLRVVSSIILIMLLVAFVVLFSITMTVLIDTGFAGWAKHAPAPIFIVGLIVILIISRIPMQYVYWKIRSKQNEIIEICNKTPLTEAFAYAVILPDFVHVRIPLPFLMFQTAFEQYHLDYLIFALQHPDEVPKDVVEKIKRKNYFSKIN